MRLLLTILCLLTATAHAEYELKIAPPANAEQGWYANHMRQTRAMTSLLDVINSNVKTDITVPVVARSCGQPNALYMPDKRQIIICYEVMVQSEKNLRKANPNLTDPQVVQSVYAETAFLLLHEVGHQLIHENQLPVLGREEDAADKIAAYVMLASGGEQILKRSVSFFATRRTGILNLILNGSSHYGDTHGLAEQRLSNLVCWGFGKSPNDFADLVRITKLPADRIQRCRGEYEAMARDVPALLGEKVITANGKRPAPTSSEISSASQRAEGSTLANTKQCLSCHGVDQRIVGPAIRDIANRYNDSELVSVLENKVRRGSRGTWGAVPAPAMPDIDETHIEILATWIGSYR